MGKIQIQWKITATVYRHTDAGLGLEQLFLKALGKSSDGILGCCIGIQKASYLVAKNTGDKLISAKNNLYRLSAATIKFYERMYLRVDVYYVPIVNSSRLH